MTPSIDEMRVVKPRREESLGFALSISDFDDSAIARFHARVKRGGEKDCWPFLSALRPDGYGAFCANDKRYLAHRVSLVVAGRDIPSGLVVDHMCRNRACVNPTHLRLVEPAKNAVENSSSASALMARKTFCIRGHPLSGDNLSEWALARGVRTCKICERRKRNRRPHTQEQR